MYYDRDNALHALLKSIIKELNDFRWETTYLKGEADLLVSYAVFAEEYLIKVKNTSTWGNIGSIVESRKMSN